MTFLLLKYEKNQKVGIIIKSSMKPEIKLILKSCNKKISVKIILIMASSGMGRAEICFKLLMT